MIGIEGEKVSEVTRLRVWKSDLWAGTGQTHSHPDATSVVLASDYEKLEAERNMWLETAHKAAHASGLLGGSVIPETLEGHITKRIAELEAENEWLYKLIRADRKYRALLQTEIARMAVFMHIHGQPTPQETIDAGKACRDEIAALEDTHE